MTSGSKLVLVLVGGAAAVAALRTLCVPVGSFREGLDGLAWGMTADSVRSVLGSPNRICVDPGIEHIDLRGDTERLRAALASATNERWVYSERAPDRPVVRDPGPDCQAPITATELGFDADGRLRWYVREAQQTPVAFDPSIVTPSATPPAASATPPR